MRARSVAVVMLALVAAPFLTAQRGASDSPSSAIITFTLDFPQSNPQHYSIAIDTTGHVKYESLARLTDDSTPDTYQSEFEMSAANRERIFAWAKQAHYFSGKIDAGNNKLAFTGTKTLSYQAGQLSNSAQYNYSSLDPVRELTDLFQSISATQEFGQRLTYYHHYQKLALDDELKQMEAQAKNNELGEIQGVAPILQQIYEDSSVMNVVRARAKELQAMGLGAAGQH
jgi:hypothetical protein